MAHRHLKKKEFISVHMILSLAISIFKAHAIPGALEGRTMLRAVEPFAAVEEPVTGLWWRLLLTLVLVLLGGLFAGLTLGLMSLDPVNLEVLKNSGTPRERKYARRILPVRKHGHLLLVTLLLANTIVNETLPLVMDSFLRGGWQAILISVTLVVIFGEILPQAVCSRYGLAIGANLVWFVKFLIVVLFIIAWPISLLLNWLLGEKDGVIYRRAGLKELVTLHEQTHQGDLTADEGTILKSVLDFREKTVASAFTPLEHVFMLDINDPLNRSTLERIIDCGHSRIPLFSKSRKEIVGMLITKKLVLLRTDEPTTLRDVAYLNVLKVPDSTGLFDMLNIFQEGKSHLAVVWSSIQQETIGIITLEDVIEELIGEEIVDECDVYVDVVKRIRVARAIQEARSPVSPASNSTEDSFDDANGAAAAGGIPSTHRPVNERRRDG